LWILEFLTTHQRLRFYKFVGVNISTTDNNYCQVFLFDFYDAAEFYEFEGNAHIGVKFEF